MFKYKFAESLVKPSRLSGALHTTLEMLVKNATFTTYMYFFVILNMLILMFSLYAFKT